MNKYKTYKNKTNKLKNKISKNIESQNKKKMKS